jgi:hypothetical protein
MGLLDRSYGQSRTRRVPPPASPTLFDTKREAYHDLRSSGRDHERMDQVENLLKGKLAAVLQKIAKRKESGPLSFQEEMKLRTDEGTMTAQEMAKELGLEINCLTGPIHTLHYKRLVIEPCGKRTNPDSGKPNTIYRIIA